MGKYHIHRLDGPHAAIREALESVGASVYPGGPLDFIVGFKGEDRLMEVKGPRGQLRASQRVFIERWKGRKVAVVRSIPEALEAIGVGLERRFVCRRCGEVFDRPSRRTEHEIAAHEMPCGRLE